MSEYYKNPMADNLKRRIDRDYIFSTHKISVEKGIAISHEDIMLLDNISELSKAARPNALKQVFVELTSKGS